MKIKDKLNSIYHGYKNLILKDEELEPLFEARYKICKDCVNNKLGTCLLCGCITKAKTHSLVETCPANYWHPIMRADEKGIYVLRSELPENLQQYFKNESITIEEWNEFKEEKED